MPLQNKIVKNIPKTDAEILDASIPPFYQNVQKPPIKTYKRGNDVTLRGEDLKNINVGLIDIDTAIFYYFREVIMPYVINEGTQYNIPIVYADAERWKSAQIDGLYRDKEGKIMLPVITIKMDNMEKNRSITHKLDGNSANIYQTYEKKYTRKNQYDNFSVLMNRAPVKEFYNVVIPDYYTITYTCSLFVSFREDLNRIIEAIGFRSDSYWGEPGKFQFKSKIDNFPITNEITEGNDRRIVSTFTLVMNGYLTPNNIDKFLATDYFKYRGKTKVTFFTETTSGDLDTMVISSKKPVDRAVTSYIAEGVNVNNNTIVSVLDLETISYLNSSKTEKADSMSNDTATFFNTAIRQPPASAQLPATSKNDFKFFVNGVYVDNIHVISFEESGTSTVLTINVSTLGYGLDSQDEVIAVGKFE